MRKNRLLLVCVFALCTYHAGYNYKCSYIKRGHNNTFQHQSAACPNNLYSDSIDPDFRVVFYSQGASQLSEDAESAG